MLLRRLRRNATAKERLCCGRAGVGEISAASRGGVAGCLLTCGLWLNRPNLSHQQPCPAYQVGPDHHFQRRDAVSACTLQLLDTGF